VAFGVVDFSSVGVEVVAGALWVWLVDAVHVAGLIWAGALWVSGVAVVAAGAEFALFPFGRGLCLFLFPCLPVPDLFCCLALCLTLQGSCICLFLGCFAGCS
jgi:hypothetical protein